MNVLRLAGALALTGLAGCSLHIDRDTQLSHADQHGSTYQVDGTINLAPGATAGNLSGVSTEISLQQGAQAQRIRTVDGPIELAARASASGDVMSVAGNVDLGSDAHVLGNVHTLIGSISLHNAVIGGSLETVSGTVMVGAGSLVNQNIVLRKPDPNETGADVKRLPTLIIGPQARVLGKIIAERGGTIWISRSAHVGAVEGATVHWFEGALPTASS